MQGKCGGRLQVIAFLTNTAVTRKIWPDEDAETALACLLLESELGTVEIGGHEIGQ